MTTLLIFLVTLAFIITTALIDAQHIKQQQYIYNHTSRAIQRALFVCAIACFSVKLALASLFLYIALFDAAINMWLNKYFLNLGNTAKWDIFWNKHKRLYLILKISTLLISILLYIKN